MYGLTLIELMMTVAIVGILLMVAAPSFQEALQRNRVVSITNELMGNLNIARSEAISRGKRVTLCKSANIDDASPTCSTSANWQDGWLIFIDGETEGDVDEADIRLKVIQPSAGEATITGSTNFAHYVTYDRNGMPGGVGGTSETLTIDVAGEQRIICMNRMGRFKTLSEGACE